MPCVTVSGAINFYSMRRKIVVAITGASGAVYARQLLLRLEEMKDRFAEVAVIFSTNAYGIWKYESSEDYTPVSPFRVYTPDNFYAPFASGSSLFDTLIICPCSMGTLGRIAGGISDDLIARTADVMLKERRRLILVPRETPLNLIHIENMRAVTLAGGIICPASPSFYSKPETIEQLVNTVVDRVLQLAGIETESYRWGDEKIE